MVMPAYLVGAPPITHRGPNNILTEVNPTRCLLTQIPHTFCLGFSKSYIHAYAITVINTTIIEMKPTDFPIIRLVIFLATLEFHFIH